MKRAIALVSITAAGLLAACTHMLQADTGHPWQQGIEFAPMTGAKGASAATLLGAQSEVGPYAIRVVLESGGSIPPHSHPDARIITVLSGEVLYGFGTIADPSGAKLFHAGEVFLVPANAPHFAFAPEGATIYQETGIGPSAFIPAP